MLEEPKPWEPTAQDGSLNPNSYSAIAAFSFVTQAVDVLDANRIALTGSTVRSMARTLATVVTRAQRELTSSASFQAGANTRLRGALFSTVKSSPLPFGETKPAWDEWVDSAVRRCKAIAAAAVDVWEDVGDEPWAVLAVDPHEAADDFSGMS